MTIDVVTKAGSQIGINILPEELSASEEMRRMIQLILLGARDVKHCEGRYGKMGETDLISRQATIVVIKCSGLDDDSKDTVVRVLEQLPSAQPETAHWEQVEVNYFADMDEEIQESMAIASMFCPRCKRYHNEVYLYGDATYGVNFCPNCGADMRGEQP